jgi:tetratricopeptide (TPR) repeat protein
MGVDTALSQAPTDYRTIFETLFIPRRVEYTLQMVRGAGPIVTKDEWEEIRHTLEFGLPFANVWSLVSQLLLIAGPKLKQAGIRKEWLPYLKQGVERSQELTDVGVEAQLQLQLGLLCQVLGKYQEADTALAASAYRYAALNDKGNQAYTLSRQAYVARLRQQSNKAKLLVEQALTLLTNNDARCEHCYFVKGALALDDNDPVSAEHWFRQSLALCEAHDNKLLIAQRSGNIGVALAQQRRFDEAILYYERAIELFQKMQDDSQRAVMQMNLGNVYLRAEKPDKALILYVEAEPALQNAHDELHLAKIELNMGIAHRQMSEWKEAERRLRNAQERSRQLNNILTQANVLDELGLLYWEQGVIANAKTVFQEALALLNSIERRPADEAVYQIVSEHLAAMTST